MWRVLESAMASTREVIAPPIFAEDASTVIPPTPIAGQSYRDPAAGPASSPDGWPYAQLVNSAEWNQLMFQWSSLLSIMDMKGLLGWTDEKDYTDDALTFGSDGKVYKWLQESGPGTVAGVKDPVSEPLYWKEFGAAATDFVNAPRVDVASASTVNLTTSAPDTINIRLTGSVTINSFTVAAGRNFIVSTSGGAKLTNGAPISTGLGVDLTLAPGESFILRATAANVVEVLCYSGGAKDVGEVTFHAEGTVPPFKLKANGAAVSRTTYARLFAKIGTTYGAGDGSTTFNLPETRGEGVRFWDDGRGIDTGRVLGSWQKGTLVVGDPDTAAPLTASPIGTGASQTAAQLLSAVGADAIVTGDYANAQVSTSASHTLTALGAGGFMNGSTRMRNIAFMGCIGY